MAHRQSAPRLDVIDERERIAAPGQRAPSHSVDGCDWSNLPTENASPPSLVIPPAPTFNFDAEWLPPFRRGDDAFVRASVMFANVPLAQELGAMGHRGDIQRKYQLALLARAERTITFERRVAIHLFDARRGQTLCFDLQHLRAEEAPTNLSRNIHLHDPASRLADIAVRRDVVLVIAADVSIFVTQCHVRVVCRNRCNARKIGRAAIETIDVKAGFVV